MKTSSGKPKILVIVGPTASGKTALSIKLAKKLNGEVVSADSRQVYKDLDIGTGKVTKKEMSGIPHYMLDIASPKRVYTVSDYKKDAEKAIEKILAKGKLPIICGGTGFYIDALIYDMELPEVKRDLKLRKKLEKLSAEKMYALLLKKDPARAKTIDPHNKVRLIRALEIIETLGAVPEMKKTSNKYDVKIIGIKTDPKKLKEKIYKRLHARIKQGMIAEAQRLHKQGLSWKRMEMLGLEYRYMAKFLQGKMTKEQMLSELEIKIGQYAKKQMTWFRKNKEIEWRKN